MPPLDQSFDGLFDTSDAGDPPDANGDVGPHHYIQALKTSFAIYDKLGTLLAGPITFNAFFSAAPATGTPCDDEATDYPVVLYDPLADRWILAFQAVHHEFYTYSPPFYECIAVSRTPDPLAGGWFRYGLQAGADLSPEMMNADVKLAAWPGAYFMSANMFRMGIQNTFDHARVWALDRTALLYGGTMREEHFDVYGYRDLLPGNVRGRQPPTGSPELLHGSRLLQLQHTASVALPCGF